MSKRYTKRLFLKTAGGIGIAGLAGCSGGGEENQTTTSPEPIESAPEELLFEIDDFEESGWSVVDEELEDTRAQRRFVGGDGSDQLYFTVWTFDTESAASDEYSSRHEEVSEDHSTESVDVGSEGFAYESGTAKVVFRDVNVIGQVEHYGVSTGSIETATEYAEVLRAGWRG